ncbi:hypothetical protein J6590_048453 [Homalodisca vitripennis]|nr:hypothetical protein J6590_048453 [Homalodisca vitripennis]
MDCMEMFTTIDSTRPDRDLTYMLWVRVDEHRQIEDGLYGDVHNNRLHQTGPRPDTHAAAQKKFDANMQMPSDVTGVVYQSSTQYDADAAYIMEGPITLSVCACSDM